MKLTREIDYVYADDEYGGMVKIKLDWKQDVTWERGELNDGYESIVDYFNNKTVDWYESAKDWFYEDCPFTGIEDSV